MSVVSLTEVELAGIGAVLSAAGHAPVDRLSAAPISGGRSNLTYRITDGRSSWVLRMPPRTGRTPSAHDVAREHRVTAALRHSGVPVAGAVLLHEDEELLGAPFAVSEFVEGAAIRTRADLAALTEDELEDVVRSLIEALVALHRVDHRAVGLETFGRPDGYAARQLRRWAGQWELTGPEHVGQLADEVIRGLSQHVPDQGFPAIVHGDYRIDNTLVRGVAVAAIVDWELSTIGDPVADVAMMHAYRDDAFDLILGAPSAWTSDRLPAADDLVTAYLHAGGADITHWDFHLALARFKVAAIAAGIDHRRRSGGSSGPGFDTAGAAVERYLELAREALPAGS